MVKIPGVNRENLSVIKISRQHYVCSHHFHGGKGPTPEFPDPLPDKAPCADNCKLVNTKTYCRKRPIVQDVFKSQSLPDVTISLGLSDGHNNSEELSISLPARQDVNIENALSPTHENVNIENALSPIHENVNSEEESSEKNILLHVLRDCESLTSDEKCYSVSEKVVKELSNNELTILSFDNTDVTRSLNLKDGPNSEELSTSLPTWEDVTMENALSEKNIPLCECESLVSEEKCYSSSEKELSKNEQIITIQELKKAFLLHQANFQIPSLWSVIHQESLVHLTVMKLYSMTKFIAIEVTSELKLTVLPLNRSLDISHVVSSFNNTTITSLSHLLSILNELDTWTICEGLEDIYTNYSNSLSSVHFCKSSQTLRSRTCELILKSKHTRKCKRCRLSKITIQKRIRRLKARVTPISKINHRFLNSSDMLRKIAASKLKNRALGRKITRLQIKIRKCFTQDALKLSQEDSDHFEEILKENPFQDPSNFKRLLLREQLRIVNSKNKTRPRKWHPAIIKWCLYMKSKSATSYEALRLAFSLPSQRTLFNYSSEFQSKSGFQESALEELVKKAAKNNPLYYEEYHSLIIDEIMIKQDLAFNSSTGELIGFQNLNSFRNEVKELETTIQGTEEKIENKVPLASHILQLMVRSLTSNFKYAYAYFPGKALKADDIYSIVFEAILNLLGAKVKILAVVCDKAGANQRFIREATESERLEKNDRVGYKCKNIFTLSGDPIFFISDPCHLIKTVRNNLLSSGSSKNMRCLKKNNKLILWQHVIDVFRLDSQSLKKVAPKLTYSHIYPNPSELMRVKLATQVLSSTVASAMELYLNSDSSETVKFIRLFDKFFDMLNVSNCFKGVYQRKKELEPYSSSDDWRFEWMTEVFLKYLEEWEEEVIALEVGEDVDKNKMLMSRETVEGIRITVYSMIDIVKFLLQKGSKFVLTSKLNQDPLELHFGKHRAANGCSDNPTVNQYQQSDKKLKILGSMALKCKRGNTTLKSKRRERLALAKSRLQMDNESF